MKLFLHAYNQVDVRFNSYLATGYGAHGRDSACGDGHIELGQSSSSSSTFPFTELEVAACVWESFQGGDSVCETFQGGEGHSHDPDKAFISSM